MKVKGYHYPCCALCGHDPGLSEPSAAAALVRGKRFDDFHRQYRPFYGWVCHIHLGYIENPKYVQHAPKGSPEYGGKAG